MKGTPGGLPEVRVFELATHRDERGYLREAWNEARDEALGLPRFVQDNLSFSVRSALRGLHLQHPHGQGKLVLVVSGAIYDVVVDVRVGSPRFGRWTGTELSEENQRRLYVPPGFAHGFSVLSDGARVLYKCTERYHPEAELGVRYDDPELAIPWPVERPLLSPRDRGLPYLRELAVERLPRFEA